MLSFDAASRCLVLNLTPGDRCVHFVDPSTLARLCRVRLTGRPWIPPSPAFFDEVLHDPSIVSRRG